MRFYILTVFCLLFWCPKRAHATHLRAADIIVEQDCNTLRYKITVRVYMNTLSSTPFGGYTESDGHLNFGDNSPLELILPENVDGPHPRPDLGPEIEVASYTTYHTFANPGIYKVTYFERDRSGGIVNIPGSLDVAYSTFVLVNAQRDHCNKLPILQVAPVDRGCKGVVFYHNAGATDVEGDSLSYELTTPSKDAQNFVDGFIPPASRSFYFNFDTGNEAGNGPPSFVIDPVTGQITWDAPGLQGEYNIAFKIIEWRFDPESQEFFMISTSIRDMQIIIEECANSRPTLTGPPDVCIEAGQTLSGTFTGIDKEVHPVKIEVFSSIFEGGPENFPATYDPSPPEFQSSDPAAELAIEWKTNCIHVREQSYQVVVKITDDPPSGPRLVTFLSWNIKVIAPAPVWKTPEPDLVNRTAKLEWEDYTCTNAEKIQLWRKVGSFPFTPAQCVSGLTVHKGYTLLREFEPHVTSFTDTNDGRKLAVGAQYCYRLVAVFKLPAGGKSYVSQEACVGPIMADAPVITNVTISETAEDNGQVLVKWMKPFDISAEQYPGPYQYEVFRSDGFSQMQEPLNVSGRLDDVTSFIDGNINTEKQVYNYQIVLYSNTQNNPEYNAIDTSSVASSVRLSAMAGDHQMLLKWEADVPWSNVAQERPWHRIYRGVAGDAQNDFALIDSVNVSENGFEFVDNGAFNDEGISADTYYCYFVETIGSYGNARVPLLFNRSQIACAYPINNLPVCTPVLKVAKTDCESFVQQNNCTINAFENEISWSIPETSGCRKDIVSFNLYYAEQVNGEFVLLKSFPSSARGYLDAVPTLARCYRISGVDANGNESELSEISCNENCPYFNLPNVFTPNADGCNDVFASYLPPSDDPSIICTIQDPAACPRFVRNVRLKVLNRWGRTVYEYRSGDNNPVTINWNGKDMNGTLLEAGTYFYVADVEFLTADPALSSRRIKGWVSLLR